MHNVQLHPSTSEDRQHETVAADLIPYKVALWRLNTSRTNFWRALKWSGRDAPSPIIKRRKVFWREQDLPDLSRLLDAFEGRCVFEAQLKAQRTREAAERAKRTPYRKRSSRQRPDPRQMELFSSAS